jgi:hypothetical protein
MAVANQALNNFASAWASASAGINQTVASLIGGPIPLGNGFAGNTMQGIG